MQFAGRRRAAHDGGGGAAEKPHLGVAERQQAGGIAVGGGLEAAGSVDREADEAAVGRHDVAVLVGDLYGDVDEIVAVGFQGCSVRGQDEMVGLAGGAHDFFSGLAAVGVICNDLELAGFVADFVPHQAVAGLECRIIFFAQAHAAAVEEEFGCGE